MRNLDVDWEGALAAIIGDIPAHLLAKQLRSQLNSRRYGPRAKSAAAEIAQEELRVTPSASEYKDFTQRVRHLSTEVERTAARINKSRQLIEQLLAAKSSTDRASQTIARRRQTFDSTSPAVKNYSCGLPL